jgi:hypothetical protein
MVMEYIRAFVHKVQMRTQMSYRRDFIVIDNATGVVLAASPLLPAVIVVAESDGSTNYIASRLGPQSTIGDVAPKEYPEWTWKKGLKTLVPTHPDVLTDELRAKSQITNLKVAIIGRMMVRLNAARDPVRIGIDFQETVYLTKKIQAQAFKDAGYDEEKIFDYPYVLQYADYKKIPLKQAADDILFKAKLTDEMLAKTELLRLRYWNMVKETHDRAELKALEDRFVQDCYANALV